MNTQDFANNNPVNDCHLNDEQLNQVVGASGIANKTQLNYVLAYGTPGHFTRNSERDYVVEYGTPGYLQ